MERSEFNELLNDIEEIKETDIQALEELRLKYPYYQNLHLLLVKAYKKLNSEKLKSALNKAAIHSVDRAYLKRVLSGEYNFVDVIRAQPIPEVKSEQPSMPVLSQQEKTEKASTTKSESTTPEGATALVRKAIGHKESQIKLIEKFIQNEPRMGKQKLPIDESEINQKDLADVKLEHSGKFLTETLAKLMVKQKKYSKAVEIYEKLKLKFPKKTAYFASQIEKIKEISNV